MHPFQGCVSALVTLVFVVVVSGKRYVHHHYSLHKPVNVIRGRKRNMPATNVTTPDKRAPEGKIESLPDFATFFQKKFVEQLTATQKYKLGGCEMGITVSEKFCKVALTPDEKTKEACMNELSLETLAKTLMKNEKLKEVAGKFSPFKVFSLKGFSIDVCKGDIVIETQAKVKEEFNILRGTVLKMQITDAQFKVEFNYNKMGSFKLADIGLTIIADVMFGKETKAKFTNTKAKGKEEGTVTIELQEDKEKKKAIKVGEFMSTFSNKEDKSSADVSPFINAEIKEPKFSGTIAYTGEYELVVTGVITGFDVFQSVTLFVVAQNLGAKTEVAVVAKVDSIKPMDAIKSLIKKEEKLDKDSEAAMKENSLVGDKVSTINVLIEYASGDMAALKDANLDKELKKFVSNGKTVSEGVKIKVEVPFRALIVDKMSKLETADKNKKTEAELKKLEVPETISIQLAFLNGEISIKFPDDFLMDVVNVLFAISPKPPKELFGNLFDEVFKTAVKIKMEKFTINFKTGEFALVLDAPEEFTLGNGLITLSKATFEVERTKTGTWGFKISAEKEIRAGETLKVSVEKVKDKDQYQFHGEIDTLDTKALLQQLNDLMSGSKNEVAVSTEDTQKMTDGFLNLQVNKLNMDATFGSKLKFQFSGEPKFVKVEKRDEKGIVIPDPAAGTPPPNLNMVFEGFAMKTADGKVAVGFGILLKDINLKEILQYWFNKDVEKIAWLQNLQASLILSNTDKSTDVDFTQADLKGKLKRGVSFKTTITLPEKRECPFEAIGKDKKEQEVFCMFLVSKLGEKAQLSLEGTVTATSMEITATYDNKKGEAKMDLWEEKGTPFMWLIGATIGVKVGTGGTGLYIRGSMAFRDHEGLTLDAQIALNPVTGSVEIKIEMKTQWGNPFALGKIGLAFVYVEACVGINPTGIPSFELGGVMTIGTKEEKKLKDIKLFVGFSPVDPLDNYFYARIPELTLQKLADAFDVAWADGLPDVVKSTGLKGELIIGHTLDPRGKDLPGNNGKLENGVTLKGGMAILGNAAMFDIRIGLKEFKMDVRIEKAITIAKGIVVLCGVKKPDSLTPDKMFELVDKSNSATPTKITELDTLQKDLLVGPSVYIRLTATGAQVKMNAYIEIFRIATAVLIDIHDGGFSFDIYGSLFGFVEAQVSVKATYGKISEAQFKAYGRLHITTMEAQSAAVYEKRELDEGSEEAYKDRGKFVDKIDGWSKGFTKKFETWKDDLNSKEKLLLKEVKRLQKVKDELNSNECIAKCKKIYIGGFDWKKDCFKFLISFSCPKWNATKYEIADLLCLTKCKIKEVYEKVKGKAMQFRIEVMARMKTTIDSILELMKEPSKKVEKLMGKVDDLNSAIKEKYKQVRAALMKLQVIGVEDITFGVDLSAVEQSMMFKIRFKIKTGKEWQLKEIEAKATLDGSFIKSVMKEGVRQLVAVTGNIKDRISNMKNWATGQFMERENERNLIDMMKSEQKISGLEMDLKKDHEELKTSVPFLQRLTSKREEILTGDEPTKEVNDSLPTAPLNASYIQHQIYDDLPTVVLRDDVTMAAFSRESPWVYSENEAAFGSEDSDNETVSGGSNKANIPKDFVGELVGNVTANNCSATRRVINTYNDLSSGLSTLVAHVQKQKEEYQAFAKDYVRKVSDLEKRTIEINQRLNLTQESADDTMFYINKWKDGTTRWVGDLDKELHAVDEKILSDFKQKLSTVLTNVNLDVPSFAKLLKTASVETGKRFTFPEGNGTNQIGENLIIAAKIVDDILTGTGITVSSKSQAIDNLREHITHLKDVEAHLNCNNGTQT